MYNEHNIKKEKYRLPCLFVQNGNFKVLMGAGWGNVAYTRLKDL